MTITKEALEKRKGEAIAARDQYLANANAAGGVIQDCEHWLAILAVEGAETVADPSAD